MPHLKTTTKRQTSKIIDQLVNHIQKYGLEAGYNFYSHKMKSLEEAYLPWNRFTNLINFILAGALTVHALNHVNQELYPIFIDRDTMISELIDVSAQIYSKTYGEPMTDGMKTLLYKPYADMSTLEIFHQEYKDFEQERRD